MTPRYTLSILLLALVLGLLSGGAHADWRFFTVYNNYLAEFDGEPHPTAGKLVVASNLRENPLGAAVCGCYLSSAPDLVKGRFIVRGEVIRTDGSRESFRIKSKIRKNAGDNCTGVTDLGPDDLISMEFEFLSLPDLRRRAHDDADRFLFGAFIVSQSGGPSSERAEAMDFLRGQLTGDPEEGSR